MVVESPPTPNVQPPALATPDAGVIEDARARQRRHRMGGVALVALAVAALLGYFVAGGGDGAVGGSAHAASVPSATGSVEFVSLRAPGYGLFTGPSLGGQASLCLTAFEPDGSQSSCGAYPLPQSGLPLEDASDDYVRRPTADGRVPAGGLVYVMLTAPNVAAVRVGDLGTVRVQTVPGLPPGDHAIAFRETAGSIGTVVPPGATAAWIRRNLGDGPRIILTALDSSGKAVPFSTTAALRQFYLRLRVERLRDWTTNAASGRCAVSEDVAGLAVQSSRALTRIAAEPDAGSGALLSCLWGIYRFEGKRYQVAVMLNASTPAAQPGPIWDAQSLAGHPGIVAVQHAPSTPDNAIVARRAGNASLAVAPWVGYPGYPSLRQRLEVLAALHLTRLDLGK